MQGFSIVFFAVWAIAGNPRAALRLSILPWIAGFAAVFAILQPLVGVGLSMLASDRIPPAMHDQGYSPALLFSLFVFGIVSCWIGMTWHRHILLRETAQSMLSRRNVEAFLLYFRAMAKVAVLAAAILLMIKALMVPLVPALGLAGPGAKVVSIAINALLISLVLRFGLVLPAAAIGRPISMGDSWAATRGYSGPVFAIAFFIVVVNELTALFPETSAAASVLVAAGSWTGMMLTLGALSVLYGVRIQGRRLIV